MSAEGKVKRGRSWTLLAVSVLLKRENLVTYFLFIKHKNVFYQAILRAKNLYLKQKIFWCLGKKSPFSCRWRGKTHREGEPKAHVLLHRKCNSAFKELGVEGEN